MDKQKMIDLVSELRGVVEKIESELVGADFKPADEPEVKKQEPPKEQDGEYEYSFINTLKVGDKNVNVKGTIQDDPVQRDVDTNSGPKTVTNMLISDGSGDLRLGFWGKYADEAMDYAKGDLVLIDNVYRIKEPYDNVLQADAGNSYKMVKLN